MDNIAQRLGLVVHWVGGLITIYAIVISFGINAYYLEKRETYLVIDEAVALCSDYKNTYDSSLVSEGECYYNPMYGSGDDLIEALSPTKSKFVKKVYLDRDILRFFEASLETLVSSWIVLFGILYGWLIRFILAGKAHILPWKK